MAKAYLGAGCFWGVEERFRRMPGVLSAVSGYMGGTVQNPTYTQVCTGRTGHAEAVEVEYDETQTTYERLLEVFFDCHDPTQKNRQGWDVGTQYRSVIFPQNESQTRLAREALEKKQQAVSKKIATTLETATQFWPAEAYHQRYLEKKRGEASGKASGKAS